jgi:hypothetical protein
MTAATYDATVDCSPVVKVDGTSDQAAEKL